jgi:hypothetical protein
MMDERCPVLADLPGIQTKDTEFVRGVARQVDADQRMPIDAATVAQLIGEISRCRATRDREIAEAVRPLRSALEWCAEQVFEGCDIDGGDFQDEMVQRGIMVSEPASDDFKAEFDANEWFVLAWKARAK